MKNKFIAVAALSLAFYSCTKEVDTYKNDTVETAEKVSSDRLMSIEEVNSFIENNIDEEGKVDWKGAPANVLWSAAVHGEKILSVGYGYEEEIYTTQRSSQLDDTKFQILSLVQQSEGTEEQRLALVDEEDESQDILNIVDVNVTKLETVKALQKADNIAFIEPIGYSYFEDYVEARSKNTGETYKTFDTGLGCGTDPDVIAPDEYVRLYPGNIIPWNYFKHNITDAWGYANGNNITVGVIDTGVSDHQYLLTQQGFTSGYTPNKQRYIHKIGTFVPGSKKTDGPHDRCGHGTSTASIIAAPANTDGHPVGVAFNSNLVAYRASKDVLLNTPRERRAVARAITQLGDRNDVKIISMSLGSTLYWKRIARAVRYADKRGKMIIAAGGTSTYFTGSFARVVFPARMNEVIAVTGVDANGARCSTCHTGKQIDFTATMQFPGWNNRNKTMPTLGYKTGWAVRFGGSSSATPMVAGIAALIWSRNPNMNKNQVYDIMRRASQFPYNKRGDFGHGNIDALKAVKMVN